MDRNAWRSMIVEAVRESDNGKPEKMEFLTSYLQRIEVSGQELNDRLERMRAMLSKPAPLVPWPPTYSTKDGG